jgi:integrase
VQLGIYSAEFTVEQARAKAFGMKGMDPATLVGEMNQKRNVKGKHSKTVDELIELRIAYISQPVQKEFGTVPRVESWQTVASHMRRFISPRLGRMLASNVTNDDLAGIYHELVKTSVSNGRHFRSAARGLFKWAAEAGRKYIERSPYHDMPEREKEYARKRVLKAAEIKTLWNALDDSKRSHLAVKFGLLTMLRPGEYVGRRVDQVLDLDGANPVLIVPADKAKKRKKIIQPLSPLAVAVVKLAMRDGDPFIFGKHRSALGNAISGRKDKGTTGLWQDLGLERFRAHDLRRTGATLAADLKFSNSAIAACLNHEGSDDAPSVTFTYQRSDRLDEKREVLNGITAKLREIAGPPKLKLVA